MKKSYRPAPWPILLVTVCGLASLIALEPTTLRAEGSRADDNVATTLLRSTVDRPDDSDEYQNKLIYAVPRDGIDRELGLTRCLHDAIAYVQSWFHGESDGRQFRFDTFQGEIDIGFLRLTRSDADFATAGVFFREALEDQIRLRHIVFAAPPKGIAVVRETADAPQSLSVTVTGRTVTLNWVAPTGTVPPAYVVEAALSPNGAPIARLTVPGTTLTVPDVPIGTYYLRVRADTGTINSAPSNEVVVVVPGGTVCESKPGTPQGLTASSTGSLVTLTWQPAAAGCPPTSYVLHAGSQSGLSDLAVLNVGAQTALTATAPPATYFVRVVAVSAFGASDASNEVVVTVGLGCSEEPAPPQNATGTATGNVVTVEWAPSTGCTPDSYVLFAGTAPGRRDVRVDVGTQLQVSGHAPDGTYYVTVVAVAGSLVSLPSNEVIITVGGSAPPPTPAYAPYRALMPQVVGRGPLYVTSHGGVSVAALEEAARMLDTMLANRPDVAATLRFRGALTAVFGRNETSCDLPYFADLAGSASCTLGGLGGVPNRPATACAERNLLKLSDDPFRRGQPAGENVCVHELAHTIMNVGVTNLERQQIHAGYATAKASGLWDGDFAMTNADEFWAEMVQSYFCANPQVPSFNHGRGVNCAGALQAYDPASYQLVHDILRGSADLR